VKFFVLLFSAYLLALNVLPCSDLAQHAANQEIEHLIVDQDSSSHDHNHGDEADSCSPFCICACCGVITGFELSPIQLPSSNLNLVEYFALYQDDAHSNELLFIWKPPKIS
jgi:hypothetical protein